MSGAKPRRRPSPANPRDELLGLLIEKGLRREAEPMTLSSGARSSDFVDVKRALGEWRHLACAAKVVCDAARSAGLGFAAVGGTSMGADPLVFAVSSATNCRWFLVRKERKTRGTRQMVEGSALSPGDDVLIVDDVATTGRSMLHAAEAAQEMGARVQAVVALVDRGDTATMSISRAGIRYLPIFGYRDLGIDPVG